MFSQSELKDSAMTLAQQLQQKGLKKGLEEGRQEGRLEGRQEDILEALSIRFGSVPTGLAERVQAIENESRLRELHRSAIRSATIEEFATGL